MRLFIVVYRIFETDFLGTDLAIFCVHAIFEHTNWANIPEVESD